MSAEPVVKVSLEDLAQAFANQNLKWGKMQRDLDTLPVATKTALYQAADVMAKVAGLTIEGEPLGLAWMVGDHPTRANLLLERLGLPQRF